MNQDSSSDSDSDTDSNAKNSDSGSLSPTSGSSGAQLSPSMYRNVNDQVYHRHPELQMPHILSIHFSCPTR